MSLNASESRSALIITIASDTLVEKQPYNQNVNVIDTHSVN